MDDFVNVEIDSKDIKPSSVALALTSLIWSEASGLFHKPDYELIRSYDLKLRELIVEYWHD